MRRENGGRWVGRPAETITLACCRFSFCRGYSLLWVLVPLYVFYRAVLIQEGAASSGCELVSSELQTIRDGIWRVPSNVERYTIALQNENPVEFGRDLHSPKRHCHGWGLLLWRVEKHAYPSGGASWKERMAVCLCHRLQLWILNTVLMPIKILYRIEYITINPEPAFCTLMQGAVETDVSFSTLVVTRTQCTAFGLLLKSALSGHRAESKRQSTIEQSLSGMRFSFTSALLPK